jgi:Lactonase, 7-bladed beta-propeller
VSLHERELSLPKPERYDDVIVGSGAGGKYLAWPGAFRPADGSRRTSVDWRFQPEYPLPAEQNEIWSAGMAHTVSHAGAFGITTNGMSMDVAKVVARKRHMIETSSRFTWSSIKRAAPSWSWPDPFHGKPWAADVHVTPDGRFLYASERTTSTLVAFRLRTDASSPAFAGGYPTERQPRNFDLDLSGKYVVAAGGLSNHVSCYSIDSRTGALRQLVQVEVGRDTNWVTIGKLPYPYVVPRD